VTDAAGQPVENVALTYRSNGANYKVDNATSTVFLSDLGEKVSFAVDGHVAEIKLGEGKYFVNIVLTEDDMLTKVIPAFTEDVDATNGIKGSFLPVGVNGTNDCGSAAAIGADGAYAFDSTGATTDGLPDVLCLAFGNDDISEDIWWSYTADCDGNATLDTCGSSFDTRIAAYDAGACPPAQNSAIACNDDSCGLQSSITFAVTSGTSYLIRVGGFSAGDSGPGVLNVSCVGGGGGGGCMAGGSCLAPDGVNALTSNTAAGFITADNFSPTADGDVTDICFTGVGFDGAGDCSAGMTDDFTITYYNDDGNGTCSGSVLAGPFSVTASRTATGGILLGVFTELEWSASHAAVGVTAGNCYWVEVANSDAGCNFAWETSLDGDARSCQLPAGATANDQAFCLNIDFDNANCGITGPANDLCDDAEAIAGQGVFAYDNTGAGTDGPAHVACDFFTDGGNTDNDIWYCWTSDCTGDVRFETCGLTGTDTKLNVYDGCGTASDANLIACNDDDCGLQSGLTFAAVSGNSYKLRVGNFPTAAAGAGAFSLSCIAIPSNDDCDDAVAVAVPSTTSGSTNFAGVDSAPTCPDQTPGPGGPVAVTAPGVWYTASGTGNTMTANTCNNPNYDTRLSVYCGDCSDQPGLTCVVANDDSCSFQSEVSWCSQAGSEYLILVHGFGAASGSFDLAVFDDGAGCTGAVQCQTAGACCTGPDSEQCTELTEADCAAIGGYYQGDDTVCSGYNASACANAFQDISGEPDLGLGDDTGIVVPLGFAFDFFGVTQNSIAVCSNGYLTFGGTLTDFTETSIPDTGTPNDLICPLWNDFSPNISGTVSHSTTGPVGNQVFIAQWTDVPQFQTVDTNTFQALLFEADNHIEFRYGTLGAQVPDINGFTGIVGIEDASGSNGLQVTTGDLLSPGDCIAIDLSLACPPPECELVFATGAGNETFNQGGHTWNTQLDGVYATYDVWLDDTPQFQIPPFTNYPNRWNRIQNALQAAGAWEIADVPYQSYSVQVVMWNPEVFPANPEQYSDVMNVTVWLSGRVTTTSEGTNDNMNITHEVVQSVEGYKYIRFPFTINGF
jgi:hypothetical protein